MTEHYHIHSTITSRTLKVSYRGGNFFRLELVAGKKFGKDEITVMAMAIPESADDIQEYAKTYTSLTYTKEEKQKTIYQQFVTQWFAFYEKTMGMPPKFDGAEGKALKQIKAHLTRLEGSQANALALFQLMLENWHKLDRFHQENTDLKYINSKLNIILNAIKRAGKANVRGTGDRVEI